ncbi:MAG: SusC/RagA family TonB-linked outer membrane protein [Bacteroidota bacterium]|nr:SusC/RagA family TonB-linked outer membrane protein [Bacteroidota bacterium]
MLKYCLKICTIGTVLVSLSWYNANARHISGKDSTNMIQREGKGTVLDEFGRPLEGVHVATKDGKVLGTSNVYGLFNLSEAVPGQKVTLDRNGYDSKTVIVKNNNSLTVRLQDSYLKSPDKIGVLYDEKDLKEVVGSVSSVYTRQLSTTPTPLYLNALTGRIAGFYTQEVSGFRVAKTDAITHLDLAGWLPSSATKYTSSNSDNSEIAFALRGQSPVTIVDGVQRDIYSLDPESIESVTVLKDALSSLLLGQKSSRGVLQVTTKKGVAGAPKLSFTFETGVQNRLKTPKPLSSYQYAYLYNEALQNDGKLKAFSSDDFNTFRNGSSPYMYPDVNWYNTITRDNAPITKYNLNVSGGLKNARYSISLSYLDQLGMFKTSPTVSYNTNLKLDRYLINSSVDIDVTNELTIGLQVFGRIQEGCQPGAGTSTVLSSLYSTPNYAYPVFNPNGSYGGSSTYNTNLYQQTAGSGYLLDNTRDLMANLDLKYKFDHWLPGLYAKFKVNASTTSSSLITRKSQQPVYDLSLNASGDTAYTRYGAIADQSNTFGMTSTVQTFYSQASLGYDSKIGDHQFGGMIFADQQRATYQFDLPETYYNLAATGNYNYKQKYFVEAALNYAGFDRFQPGHQFGLFYAGGLGWNIAEESFLKDNVSWIDLLKVRGTYGLTGNSNEGALGYFTWRHAFGQDGTNGYAGGSSYSMVWGVHELNLANVNATWEKAHKLDVGADMAFLKSRLKVVFDYYYDVYYDLLQQRGSNTQLMGYSYPNENLGKNLYTGQELQVTYQDHVGNLNFFVTANASRMKTEVLYMDELQQKYDWNKHTGKPVGQTFGYLANGLIQTQDEASKAPLLAGTKVYPGDIKLVDLNGDGVIDQFDQTVIGNTKPIIYYGATLGFSFKGFDFSVLLQGVKNRTYQQTDYSFGAGGKDQGYDFMLGRWTPETAATATYPRLTVGFNANNTPYLNNSSFWTRSGEYFRVKNIDIGYTFQLKANNRLKVSGIRIFANAQNLFTVTPYDRLDPEINGTTSYPIQRIINAGINIKL